jgi:hypothetical protein
MDVEMSWSDVPMDVYNTQFWKYLPVEDIINYCLTDSSMQRICNNPSTWKYLLKRDYGVTSTTDNPEHEYMVEQKMTTYINHINGMNNQDLHASIQLFGNDAEMKFRNMRGEYAYSYINQYGRDQYMQESRTINSPFSITVLNMRRQFLIDLVRDALENDRPVPTF